MRIEQNKIFDSGLVSLPHGWEAVYRHKTTKKLFSLPLVALLAEPDTGHGADVYHCSFEFIAVGPNDDDGTYPVFNYEHNFNRYNSFCELVGIKSPMHASIEEFVRYRDELNEMHDSTDTAEYS